MPVKSVIIDTDDIPSTGSVQSIIRTTEADKKAINRAARVLGIPQAAFLRVAALNVARNILEEVE